MKILKKPLVAFTVILCVCVLITGISITLNTIKLSKMPINPNLIGEWSGEVVLSYDNETNEPDEIADMEIMIEQSGNVSGKIGNAEFVGCQLSWNRTKFERLIDFKTDYIILGSLDGNVGKYDSNNIKISIPFNITKEKITGTLFRVEKYKYPDPIVPGFSLNKSDSREQE